MPLLPLGHACCLQNILLSDLVGSDRTLQIVLNVWCTFLKCEARHTSILVSSGLSHLTQEVQTQKEVHQTGIAICRGLAHPPGWAALPSENIGIFSRVEKISEDINSR